MVKWKEWLTAKINILANPKCLKLATLGHGQVDPPPPNDECPCTEEEEVYLYFNLHSILEMHTPVKQAHSMHFDHVIGMHVCCVIARVIVHDP